MTSTPSLIGDLIDDATVIVCCGSGGVGKTTTAAVLGIEAARRGRRVVVVTIDPARRLADALGMQGGLSGLPQMIPVPPPVDGQADRRTRGRADRREDGRTDRRADRRAKGATGGRASSPEAGELWAMMLDTPAMFERVVRSHAANAEQADRIVANRFYQNAATALSGTQEYMASEALHELHGDERFDLVVVDTPPSRNALDFLDAPGVLARFLDHRAFKLLMMPTRTSLRVLSVATQPLLRAIGRVVGSDVLADTVAFFQAFAGMETGFRERAEQVTALLHEPSTRFLLVASPQHDTVTEAVWFAQQLVSTGFSVSAAVINRMQPRFGDGTVADATTRADTASKKGDHDVAALWSNLATLRTIADAQRGELAPLITQVGADHVIEVPQLPTDVHDLDALGLIAVHLFAP